MKSLIILSLVIPLLLLFLVNTSNADTADIWKLCQSSTECYYCLTYYCTQDTGSWGWRTSVNPDRCGGNSDGWYCSGNVRENRDYKCNAGGSCTSSGGCTYTVSSSENCITKTSTDTDGGNVPLTAGTVTDYTGCTGSSCTSNAYSDSCSSNTLTEYYPNGASYSSTTYNCESYETLYASGGDIYRNEWQCSGNRCNDGAADTLVQDCSDTCSDSDGGQIYTTQGTVTDYELASGSDTSCPSSTYTDSCSGTTLTEYYCSVNDYTSATKNCNDYDSVSYDITTDACSWNNYGCSSGACSSSGPTSLDCDTYDSISGSTANDYEVSSTSCTLGCTGSGCCYIDNSPTSCSATTSCQSTTVEGTSYKCHRTNAGAWQWDTGTLPLETACSDTYDNDCDDLIDNNDSTSCDATSPSSSVSINSGATYTTSTSATLSISCSDSGSGMKDYRYNCTGSWSNWVTCAGCTASQSCSLSSGDGIKTASIECRDNANNVGPASDTIILDTTPPSCSISSITESSSYAYASGTTVYYSTASTGSFTVAVSVSDASGVQKVNFPNTVSNGGDDTSSPYSLGYNWDTSDTFDTSASATCYDNAGNTNTAPFTVNGDITSPSGVSISYTDGYYTTASVTLTLSEGTDTESGVNTASDYIGRKEATLSAGSCGTFGAWSTIATNPSSPFTDTVSNGKCYKYNYTVSDNVNNKNTHLPSATAKIDTTLPSVGQAEIYSGTTYQSGTNYWYKGTVSIRAPASDSESGISICEYTTDGSAWSSATYDGTYCNKNSLSPATTITINLRATNGAGRTTAVTSTSRTYTYDATEPTTSISATSPPDGASYTFGTWTKNDVKITLSCTDNSGGSGCSTTKYCTDTTNTCTPSTAYSSPFTISTEGTTYVRYGGTDNLGTPETIQSKTVKIDKTDPSVNMDTPPASSWQKSPSFTLQYDANDEVSIPACKLYTKSSSEASWQDRGTVICGTGRTVSITVGSTGYCKDQGLDKCQVKVFVQDEAGRMNEAARYFSIDWENPSSSVTALVSCRKETTFPVSWSGNDNPTGTPGTDNSGLANYDIQYKKNAGSWADCLTTTTSTSMTFPSGCSSPPSVGNADSFYYQSRSRDNAGNAESYPGGSGDTSTTIDLSGPNAPSNLLPSDGILTSDNTPDLSWQPPTDNGCSNSVSGYEIQIGSSCGTGSVYSTTSTTYTPSTALSDGTYYWKVRAKDGLNNWGSWSSCNSIQIDTTVSAGISINTAPNDILTNTQSVTLYLNYPVDKDKCRYSNDGVWDTEPWETCASTKSWTLTSGYETKTVYYQVRDLAGNIGQASDSIELVPNPSYATGEVNVEGTIDYLHISWDINGFRTRDMNVDCKLNCDPRTEDCATAQGCSIQQKQGTGSCSIISPTYDFIATENKVVCTLSYKDNPTIKETVNKNFKLIDFQVSVPSTITATIGEQAEARLTIKNKGILQDSYSLSSSITPLAIADKFNLRGPTSTAYVNPNEITTSSFFISPLIEPPGSPNLRITVASSVNPAKSQEVTIPITTTKFVLGLPEFYFLGLLQIIFLALILLYLKKN